MTDAPVGPDQLAPLDGLDQLAADIQELTLHLAETTIAELQYKIQGQDNSREETVTGRTQDGVRNAINFTTEKIRLEARLANAQLEYDTLRFRIEHQ